MLGNNRVFRNDLTAAGGSSAAQCQRPSDAHSIVALNRRARSNHQLAPRAAGASTTGLCRRIDFVWAAPLGRNIEKELIDQTARNRKPLVRPRPPRRRPGHEAT